MAKTTKINPLGWYTLQDIVQMKAFPWLPSYWSVRKAITTPKVTKVLQPVVRGKGKNVRYQFKGENIIKFIKAVETGTVRL